MGHKRKFELLRDLPGIPKGTRTEEWYENSPYATWVVFRQKNRPHSDTECIRIKISDEPTWVREIEEKEFTRSEMIEFANGFRLSGGAFENTEDALIQYMAIKSIKCNYEKLAKKNEEPYRYKIGDMVSYKAYAQQFKVVDFTPNQVHIEGDWSNQANICITRRWVDIKSVKPCPKKQEAEAYRGYSKIDDEQMYGGARD